jgi:hypothetical protein
LVVEGTIEKNASEARFWYDFGMEDRVSIKRENNMLHNYSGDNPECDPIKTVISTVKYDLQHAFNHYQGDPNYGKTHWSLYGNLKDRTVSYDWWEVEEVPVQLELDFS